MGLQAQEPLDPYTALWSRLDGFRPADLSNLLEERRAVRTVVMRSTVHLVSTRDCLLLHADRSRFYAIRERLAAVAGPVQGTVLGDGVVCGVWHVERDAATGQATLVVEQVTRLTKRATAAVAAEGRRYLRFVAADADRHEVRFLPVP